MKFPKLYRTNEEMERIREETGVSVSRQIGLRLLGYEIVKIIDAPTIEEAEEQFMQYLNQNIDSTKRKKEKKEEET